MKENSNKKRKKISESDLYRRGYIAFHIIPSLTCNLRCKYCYIGDRRKDKTKLNLKKLAAIIKKIEGLKLSNIFYEISGGEIFLQSDWYKIFNLFLKTKRFVSINTNGSTIKEKDVKKIGLLSKKYKKNLYFSISLDSHIAKIHNSIRGKFKETIETIKLFKKHKIPFRICIVLSGYNGVTAIETIEYIVKNLNKEFSLGTLRPVFPIKKSDDKIFLDLPEIQKIHKDVLSLKKNLNFEYYHSLNENDRLFCMAGLDRVAILPNGDIFRCYALINSEKPIGNIFKDDLSKILKYLYKDNINRDKEVLLCEHFEDRWGKPPIYLGK